MRIPASRSEDDRTRKNGRVMKEVLIERCSEPLEVNFIMIQQARGLYTFHTRLVYPRKETSPRRYEAPSEGIDQIANRIMLKVVTLAA